MKSMLANLGISLSSLVLVLVIAEAIARALIEPTMVVKVEVPVKEFVAGPEVALRGADGSIEIGRAHV